MLDAPKLKRDHTIRGHMSEGRMQSLRAFLIIPVLLGASACAPYDPPVQGDHTAEQYKADLEKCRTTSTESVRLKNAATIQSVGHIPIHGSAGRSRRDPDVHDGEGIYTGED